MCMCVVVVVVVFFYLSYFLVNQFVSCLCPAPNHKIFESIAQSARLGVQCRRSWCQSRSR